MTYRIILLALISLKVLSVSGQNIPTYNIDDIRSNDINGKADSIGTYCKIEAIVQSINFRKNEYLFYINDGTGGLAVRDYEGSLNTPYNVTRGDKIRVIGEIDQVWHNGYNTGETYIRPDSIVLLSSGHNTVPPIEITKMSEQYEGLYVTLKDVRLLNPGSGYWSNSYKRFHAFAVNKYNVNNGQDYIRIHVHDNSGVYKLGEPINTFNLSGFLGQYDVISPYTNRYCISPQFESDLDRIPESIPIDSIQYVHPDSLKMGIDDPLYFNYKDTVTIEGVVMMHPGYYAGKGTKQTWLQSESGKAWGGIMVHAWPIWHGMTTAQILDSLDMYEKYHRGTKVKVRGLTYNYQKNTEIVLLPEEPEIIQEHVEIEPKKLDIDQFSKGKGSSATHQLETGEKWENVYVQFDDVWVSRHYNYAPGHSWFYVIDKDSNEIQVYPLSGYFRSDGLSDSLPSNYTYELPPVGVNLEYIRGIIYDYNGRYELVPLYPDDVKVRSLQPDICMVMVDTNTNRNMVVWERPVSSKIDSYRVYRESTQAGKYELIGTRAYNELSVVVDTNSNPLQRAYRYALSVIDKNGLESEWSDIHKTLHLTANKGVGTEVNLIWSNYKGFEFNTYKIYRGTTPTNLKLIDSIQSTLTSYTDVNAPSGLVFYQVVIEKTDTCYPSLVRAANYSGPFSQSLSNLKDYNTLEEDYLKVLPSDISVSKEKGTRTFSVFTNKSVWLVQSDQSWLSYNQDLDNKTVTLYFGENTTGSDRTATITLLSTGVDDFEVSFTQSSDGATSIKTITENGINLFPNPAQNMVTVSGPGLLSYEKIDILDLNGKTLKVITGIHSTNLSIDLSGIEKGIYLIRFTGHDSKVSRLFVR